jgi:hypothetical protein
MNLPKLPRKPSSPKECVDVYLERLQADVFPWPQASMLLTAYSAWPNAEAERDSLVATCQARFQEFETTEGSGEESVLPTASSVEQSLFERFGGVKAVARPAFDALSEKIARMQSKWLLVADIFQVIVDMAYDNRIVLRRGSSISKAIDLCELEYGLPGHSQLRKAWSDFCGVAHVLTAAAHLAHEGLTHAATAQEASILKAIWIAPDAVLALAAGLQEFGLQPKSIRGEPSILRPDEVWGIPTDAAPEKPFITFRPLTQAQLDFLSTRRVSKKYIPLGVHAS